MCRTVPEVLVLSWRKYTWVDGGIDGVTNFEPMLTLCRLMLDSYCMLKVGPEGRVVSRTKSMDSINCCDGGW